MALDEKQLKEDIYKALAENGIYGEQASNVVLSMYNTGVISQIEAFSNLITYDTQTVDTDTTDWKKTVNEMIELGRTRSYFSVFNSFLGESDSEDVVDPQGRRINKRRNILEEAERLINGDRAHTYGPPEISFGRIGSLLTAMGMRMYDPLRGLHREVNAVDAALALTQLKISRIVGSPEHEDSWVDAAGYIGLGAEMATRPGPVDGEANAESPVAPEDIAEADRNAPTLVAYFYPVVTPWYRKKPLIRKYTCNLCSSERIFSYDEIRNHMYEVHPEIKEVRIKTK